MSAPATALYGFTAKATPALGDYLHLASTADGGADRKVLVSALFTSPQLTTPDIGAATGTSLVLSGAATAATFNKVAITAPASGSTLTIANDKTLTVNNTLAFTGTDSTTMTLPSTSATLARTDAAQTFTGDQTFSGTIAGAAITATSLAATGAVTSTSATAGIGYAAGAGGTGTEVAGAVTVNKVAGTITTSSLTAAAAGEYVITVTNSAVAATDVPVVGIKAYAGAGTPVVNVTAVAAGSFVVTITNLHASTALNATATLNFAIFKAVAS